MLESGGGAHGADAVSDAMKGVGAMAILNVTLHDNIIKSYPNAKAYEDTTHLIVYRDDATKEEIAKFKQEVWKYWELVDKEV